jgi:hypothetical protein
LFSQLHKLAGIAEVRTSVLSCSILFII